MNITSEELQAEMVGSVGYILLGAPAAVANFIIAASIAKYSPLRLRKEMIILMALALADSINAVGHFAAGIYRLTVLFSPAPNGVVSVAHCLYLPHTWIWSFSVATANQMLVIVSIDRFLLVSLRQNYIFGLGLRYAWGTVVGCYLSSMSFGVIAIANALIFGNPNAKTNMMCHRSNLMTDTSDDTISVLYDAVDSYGVSFMALLSVFIFALVLPVHRLMKNKAAPSQNELNAAEKLKYQHKLTKTTGISCLCTLLLACIPLRLGAYLWHSAHMYTLSYLCYVVALANPLANFIIYHFSQKDLRTAFHGFLHCKELPPNIDLWHAKPPRRKPKVQLKVEAVVEEEL